MKISAVIITFNEEKNIQRCLNSLKDVVEEILIIDSGSTDNTQRLAEAYEKVKFIKQEWLGYSKTKNWGNEKASFDWILSIDADECLSNELKNSILQLKKNPSDKLCVYEMNRLTNYCGQWIKYAGWYPDKKVRLFPKNYAFWEGDFVHEVLKYDLPVQFLKGNLLHYSYETVLQHKAKALKYAELHAQQMLKQQKKVNFIKLFLSPLFTFFKMYFIKWGILEGKLGFQLCWISAWGTYKKYELLKIYLVENNETSKS